MSAHTMHIHKYKGNIFFYIEKFFRYYFAQKQHKMRALHGSLSDFHHAVPYVCLLCRYPGLEIT